MRTVLAAATALLVATPASPHERWADGSPVPPWVKTACCGPEDVHHLRPEQVHLGPDGYHVEGYPDVVPTAKALPSADGEYWIFYRDLGNGRASPVYCFFVPFSGT